MHQLLEVADVARTLNVTSATIRSLAKAGRLPIAAMTPRGVRLFRSEDVLALQKLREARRSLEP
jgi:excisionase family DNA binding protein